MPKTILLTGFEPFGGERLNASWEVVRGLDGQKIGLGHRVVSALLPCTFTDSLLRLDQLLALHQPDIIVAVGQAGGRAVVLLERVAINLQDASIPDNAGRQPTDQLILEGGPAAYFTTLPVKAIATRLRVYGIPVEISLSAGAYVCNSLFYSLMHAVSTLPRSVRAGFVHIPYLPGQAANKANAPSMAESVVTQALRLALSVTAAS
ncbi:pyroglutamyl-peptidase I [Pseudomonas sp. GD03721]|nr:MULTISPECIES: pyroglutamyl-peptidase I [unclassified Pseudomonas]MDG0898664.1 pyroglutamyl-peptidase I [Pseudomonas sp. L01]MDH1442848.1 pyroglutamyl-peptidase I [Pseudomonas sp. GD03722]WGG02103.1 pyroglutamyl-peptidase I [Pseudomonas sp. GD03721]WGG06272.1 pyroglutamyl-peptidase I [Pseudomonas sp. GD03919]